MADFDQELDASGLNCPLPILRAKKSLAGMESQQVLHIIATDPGSIPDVAALSRRTGHQVLDQSEGGGEYVCFIRKS